MTLEELNAKVRQWDLTSTGGRNAESKYSGILDQLYYHSSREWRVYLPASHPDFSTGYMDRLAAWVGNANSDDDQKLLLEYALCINFFSQEDFVALYRTAMEREISRWVASQIGANLKSLDGQSYHDAVHKEAICHTWYCPVTDSFKINDFHKVNHIHGVRYHPTFDTLQMPSQHPTMPNKQTATDWIKYMANPSGDPQHPALPLKRIVLLEDIVGSANQCLNAIRWAVSAFSKPVLFVPLILCPNGVEKLEAEVRQSGGRLAVQPVIQLQRSDLLGPERKGCVGWPVTDAVEDLARRMATRASAGMDPFGYRSTGCSLVTFSNTPDNTLPMVHNKPQNGSWEPLFPRVHRD